MIKHFKLFNHKGIKKIYLSDLGQTNIICGKNSSGKSSILESFLKEDCFSFGVNLNEVSELLLSNFSGEANRYSNPEPFRTMEWFKLSLEEYFKQTEICFSSDVQHIIDYFKGSFTQNVYLKNRDPNIFNYNAVFDSIFTKEKNKHRAVLLPPKRQFFSTTPINLDEKIKPDGEGTVNKLFFLKNHDLHTKEYITFEKIRQIFLKITNCSFNIIPQSSNNLKLQFRVEGNWIDAENCGLGVKDLLFLITFIQSTDYTLYLVEEPENHLHADFQKKLLHFLTESSQKQFIISTHSNIFLDTAQVDKIFYSWFEEEVKISDKTSMSKIIDALGYSITENLTSDAIILTEGPTDVPIIKKALSLNGNVDDTNIKFWPLGGDMMASFDLSLFSNVKNIFALIDNDTGSQKTRNAFKANCKVAGIPCIQLKRYSIENYIPLQIIKETFPNQIKRLEPLDDNQSVDIQLGLKLKGSSIKGKNYIMAEKITQRDLENTDLWAFVLKVSEKIKSQVSV